MARSYVAMRVGGRTHGEGATVTLEDVARRCGLSVMSCSRAFSPDDRHVSKETRRRILAAARAVGYDPGLNHAARRLSLRRCGKGVLNHAIGLFFPGNFHSSDYFYQLFSGVMDGLNSERFGLLVHNSWNPVSKEPKVLPLSFARGDVDGVIVYYQAHVAAPLMEALRLAPGFASRPVVSLVFDIPGAMVALTDDFQGGYLATDHLLSLGHRSILHFLRRGAPRIDTHERRLLGCEKACAERGLTPAATLQFISWSSERPGFSARRLLEHLARHPEVTAILANNDLHANGLLAILPKAGFAVPRRLSLVGFDDAAISPGASECFLSTIRLPLRRLGLEASRMMIKAVTGQPDCPDRLVLPVELVARGSTAERHSAS